MLGLSINQFGMFPVMKATYLDFSCRVGDDSDWRLVAEADAALSASRSAFSRSMEPERAKVRRCFEMQMIWSRSLCTVASSVTCVNRVAESLIQRILYFKG